jgi:hypothetical protein
MIKTFENFAILQKNILDLDYNNRLQVAFDRVS